MFVSELILSQKPVLVSLPSYPFSFMFNKENVEGALSVVAYTHNSSARETMGLGGLRVESQPVLQNESLFKTETN